MAEKRKKKSVKKIAKAMYKKAQQALYDQAEQTGDHSILAFDAAFEDFSCSSCRSVAKCEFAFDYYNTDGECLASK